MKPKSFIHLLTMTPPARRQGFSLIELMIAMTLGLLLLAGLFYIYINASQSSRVQGALAQMQTNARYSFELMGLDIRMVGFTGSLDTDPSNAVPTATVATNSSLCPMIDLFGNKGCTNGGAGPLVGYYQTYPPTVNVCTGTATACYLTDPDSDTSTPSPDSLTVVRVDNANKYTLDPAVPLVAGSFTLSTWPTSNPPQAGEIFVAADYSHAAVFQVSTVNSTTGIIYYTGTLVGSGGKTFAGGINALGLYRLSGVSYYIGKNPAGEPALYRHKLDHSGGTAVEELVQGVENMQITYGVDTSANEASRNPLPGDGSVDSYWTATQVSAGTDGSLTMPAGTASDYWQRVLSVRIKLFLVSGQNEKVGTTGGQLQKDFTNTIAIRNRL